MTLEQSTCEVGAPKWTYEVRLGWYMYGCALPLHGSTFRTGAFGAITLHYPDGDKVTLLFEEHWTNDRSFGNSRHFSQRRLVELGDADS